MVVCGGIECSGIVQWYHVCLLITTRIRLENMTHNVCVAVPGRNQTLFSCVIRPCYRVRSTVVQNFR